MQFRANGRKVVQTGNGKTGIETTTSTTMKHSYKRLGITIWSNEIDITKMRPTDLFAIAQDIFDKDGPRLANKQVAAKLLALGKTEAEIIKHPNYAYTCTAK